MPKVDYGSGASGVVSGVATGSIFGPVGGVIGGIAGGIAGLFGGKKKKKAKKISTLDPQQQALYDDYVASIRGEGPFSDMYNFDDKGYNEVFDKTVGRPAYRNFEENIIPRITGQFRQNNLMNSSYAGESLSRAGRDVQENLDAQRSANVFNGQQQAKTSKQNAMNQVLNMQTFAYEKPGAQKPSTVDQILNSLAPQAGEWVADQFKNMRKTA